MRLDTVRNILRWIMILFYAAAGIVHLSMPDVFMPVMPGWIPAPHSVILITGICEIAGAAGLVLGPTRRLAGAMLALYAVCVFPVNIKHAMLGQVGSFPGSWWYHGPRLAFQPVLVWWALFVGGATRWPFRRAAIAQNSAAPHRLAGSDRCERQAPHDRQSGDAARHNIVPVDS
jgi:uncharacterized membrane protein